MRKSERSQKIFFNTICSEMKTLLFGTQNMNRELAYKIIEYNNFKYRSNKL